jgi:hypothetical protein
MSSKISGDKEATRAAYEEAIKIGLAKQEVELPGTGKLITTFIDEIIIPLKEEKRLFFRPNTQDIVIIDELDNKENELDGFIILKPGKFITLIEEYITPVKNVMVGDKKWEYKEKSISTDLSSTMLQSEILKHQLPKISNIFRIPLLMIYENKITFPKKGYDERFKSWLDLNSINIKEDIPLEKAKQTIEEIYSEFCFETPQDKTNAIAALITPACRGLYSRYSSRTPCFFYIANRERAGKDYCAGITGIIYEGFAIDETALSTGDRNSSDEAELRKKITSTLLEGRKRLHFANNKGFINNAVLEGFLTSEVYEDRILGRNETKIFQNDIELSLSGNVGIEYTPDLANRTLFIKLFLDLEDPNQRLFKQPNLHKHVLDNRQLILSSIYTLIKNWDNKGRPSGTKLFSSYPEWAKVCGGIMEAAGYESPCINNSVFNLGGDTETQEMKILFKLAYDKYPDKWIEKNDLKVLLMDNMINYPDMFDYDFERKSDQTRFGNKITKFAGRILGDIRLVVQDEKVRTARQKIKFIINHGHLGNLGNLRTLDYNESSNVFYIGEYTGDTKDAMVTNTSDNTILNNHTKIYKYGVLKYGSIIHMPCSICGLNNIDGWSWYNEKKEVVCDMCSDLK